MLDTTRQVFWGTWLFSWTCFCYSKGFSTRDQLRCVFFQIILDACLQLQNYDEQTDIAMVQEPAWANLRECCNLFATISAHAAFSDIFTLNAVGVMTEDLKHLFLIQVTNWTLWSDCNDWNITPLHSLQNQSFEHYISETILSNSSRLFAIFVRKILKMSPCCNTLFCFQYL